MGLSKLKFLRLKKGLTQWEMAKMVGTSETHLSRIENERTKLDPSMAAKIADVLGISLQELNENFTDEDAFKSNEGECHVDKQ
jgi:transcriptional regulator with XRE-family HTH domain